MTKYLIIGPSWIGDMIMANALFRVLKQQQPDCVIDVLAPQWSHPVLARMPEVRKAIVMPVKHGILDIKTRYSIGKSLRDAQYDHAIVLPNSWKSALIPFFARIPKRTGWRGEWRYGLLNDVRVLDEKRYPLMVERYIALGLAKNVSRKSITEGRVDHGWYGTRGHGCPFPRNALTGDVFTIRRDHYPHLIVNTYTRDITTKKYHIHTDKPLLVLCPGAQYGNSKRWPEDYFAKVAQYFLEKNWQVGLLGGKAESDLVHKINAYLTIPAVDLTSTTLSEAIDIMSFATVVVSNDSGLMHMGCALDRNVIAIYGSSSPGFTPPLSEKAVILSKSLPCKPCFQRECPLRHLNCLKMITPEKVIHEIEKFVSKKEESY